jgi:hypothetical protein
MKKMILVFLMLLTMGYKASWANPESKVSIVNNGEIFKVIYNGPTRSTVRLTISTDDGQEIFAENIIGQNFMRPYNFSNLPKGNYKLCVMDQNGEHHEKLCYKEKKQWTARISELSTPDKYLVAIPYQGDGEVFVEIYDHNSDRLIYNGTERVVGDFGKIYYIKGSEGPITFRVANQSGQEQILLTEPD